MKLFDELLEKSAKLADQAAKVAGEAFEQSKVVAGEAMDKGKKKMEELSLEGELSKAQKQLGSLVYIMHKTGEENPELLQQYFAEIEAIEEKLANLKSAKPAETEEAEDVSDVADFSLEDIEKAADELALETAEIVVEEVYADEEEKTEE